MRRTAPESRVVLQARHGPALVRISDATLASLAIEVGTFDEDLSDAAFDAFRRYGKGQGHPAQLNICDCSA